MLSFNADIRREYFKADAEKGKYGKKFKRMKMTIKDILLVSIEG